MAICPGLPGWAGTRKVEPIWILLKQETVSGSGISWAICKSAPRSRHITKPAPHHSVFYRPDTLPAAQPTASKHWRRVNQYTYNWIITGSQFCVKKRTTQATAISSHEDYVPPLNKTLQKREFDTTYDFHVDVVACGFLCIRSLYPGTSQSRTAQLGRQSTHTYCPSDPSTVRKKTTGHFAGHIKKYRTFDGTSEAYFTTLVRHYCISAVF